MVYNTKSFHPLIPYAPAHVAHVIDFFTTVFNLAPAISSTNQIWWLKELFTVLALVGAFLFLVPCAGLPLRLPVFQSLVHAPPPAVPLPERKGKILFWVLFFFSRRRGLFSFHPNDARHCGAVSASQRRDANLVFPAADQQRDFVLGSGQRPHWPHYFCVALFLRWEKNGLSPAMWGMQTSVKEIGKTIILALILFRLFYSLLFTSHDIFHTDFRFTFVAAAAAFPPKMLLVALEYLPLFLFFISPTPSA